MGYTGQRAEMRKELIVEALPGIGIRVTLCGKVDARGPSTDPRAPDRLAREVLEQAVNEDSRAAQQHKRHSKLKDNQHR